MKRIASILLLVGLSTGLAVAQPQPRTPTGARPAKATPPPTKIINIEGDDLIGDRPTGELVPIGVREMATSSSLLRIRHDFIDLILKSAEQV